MRSVLILTLALGLGALGAHAGEWALLPELVDETTQTGQPEIKAPAEKKFLLHRIIAGQPVYYAFHAADSKKSAEFYRSQIVDFFTPWFEETIAQINKSKREAEFADVLPILKRGADLRAVEEDQKANVVFHFDSLEQIEEVCGEGALGCFISNTSPVSIYLPIPFARWPFARALKKTPAYIGIHEVGHALGLADQSKVSRSGNSDVIFGEQTGEDSIMNSSLYITCDDATGLINAIDLIKGSAAPRKGLCAKDPHLYRNGTDVSKSGNRLAFHDYQKVTLETYENGGRVCSKTYAFDFYNPASPFVQYRPQTVLKKDNQGRTAQAAGADGEEIYYAYLLDGRAELVVKDGKVKQLSKNLYFPEARRAAVKYERVTFFGLDGELNALIGTQYADKVSEVQWVGGIEAKADPLGLDSFTYKESLLRSFDHTGSITQHIYEDNTAGKETPVVPDSISAPSKGGAVSKTKLKNSVSEARKEAQSSALDKQVRGMDKWLRHLPKFFE